MLSLATARRLMALVALAALLAAITPAQAQTSFTPRALTASLRGSGATSPASLYAVWIDAYKKSVPTVVISYQAVGSGQGQRDFVDYQTDFGATDAAISAQRVLTQAPDTLHIPVALLAVVPTYNLPEAPGLRFSGETLVDIYLGQITRWDDPSIAADNPGVKLPPTRITVVARSDPAGATAIWTDYLSKISFDWRKDIGAGLAVRWPAGVTASGNSGVARRVALTNGAIGYVERAFAVAQGMPLPAIKNAAGNYTPPVPEAIAAAATGVSLPGNLVASLANSPNAGAYPIVGYTYFLVRQNTYTDLAKAQALTDFIYWGLTEGGGAVTSLGFVPLSSQLREAAIGQLEKVRVRGERVFEAP